MEWKVGPEITIGTVVRALREIRVIYGKPEIPDDVVPAGTMGVVKYLPKEEDPQANFDIGVTWAHRNGDGTKRSVGIEVTLREVEVVELSIGAKRAIAGLLDYSWKDIDYKYGGLAPEEKGRITSEQFEEIKKFFDLGREP